jgi:hypothetical protein
MWVYKKMYNNLIIFLLYDIISIVTWLNAIQNVESAEMLRYATFSSRALT